MPPIPANNENTGVMQHKEAMIAANNPALALFDDMSVVLMIPILSDWKVSQV